LRRIALFLLVPALLSVRCHGRPRLEPQVFPVATDWTAQIGDVLEGAAIEAPLATDGTRVFVATTDGVVRGLDGGTGTERWKVPSRPGFLSARPGLVVVRESDGTVWSVAPATGSARWKVETKVAGSLPAGLAEDAVYVGGAGLVALDAASGSVRWTADPPPQVSAPPVASGQRVLVPEEDGTLRCRNATTGAVVWAFSTRKALRSGPVVDTEGKRVLLGSGDRRFLAIGLEDGKEHWTWKIGAQVQGWPVVLDDKVFFATHENVLYALKRGGGSLVWQAVLPSRPISAPLLANGAVLVACYGARPRESFVVGFDVRTGRRLGDLKTTAELAAPPILLGDALVAGLRDRSVVRLAFARPESPEGVDKPPAALPD